MNRSQSRSCGTKVQYESLMLAENTKTLLQWKGRLMPWHIPYKCLYCPYYHIGTSALLKYPYTYGRKAS